MIALAGCGGGSRQDAGEKSDSFKVSLPGATFPEQQTVAKRSEMNIAVRNDDSKTLPNVAVTINSFNRLSQQPGLQDPRRPVWIVDHGPTGGTTTYNETWALGALAPGQTKTFTWRVTAIEPGSYTVNYRVAAGLNGKAQAKLADGTPPRGTFSVTISGTPADARVDPATGKVIRRPRFPAGKTTTTP
jgi:hypothetical protein